MAGEREGCFWVEHDIRKVAGIQERVESGPVRFGDDWPGTFIRGDHSANVAMFLRAAAAELRIRNYERHTREALAQHLEALARTFGLCDISGVKEPKNGR